MKNPLRKKKKKGKNEKLQESLIHQASSAFPNLNTSVEDEEGDTKENGEDVLSALPELSATKEEGKKLVKTFYHTGNELPIFGERSLMMIAALVTLFLQIISFVTTYGGAVPYFNEIFFLAPLLFAVAVQSVVYFLENSIRSNVHFAKVLALLLAMACSSYFSYIGIYNQVNSPNRYYEETYTAYQNNLQTEYDKHIADVDVLANDQIHAILNGISENYAKNVAYKKELNAAIKRLDSISSTSTDQLVAPKQEDFQNYEEYTAAYNAYVNSSVSGKNRETIKERNKVLAEYGFQNRSEVETKQSEITGTINTLKSSVNQINLTLGGKKTSNFNKGVERIREAFMDKIGKGEDGLELTMAVTRLVELGNRISEGQVASADEIITAIRLKSIQQEALMEEFETVANRPSEKGGGQLKEFPMELKNGLESEIKAAITETNKVMTLKGMEGTYKEEDYILYDIYDMPIINLMNKNTRNIAVVCLMIAVLVDTLSLIFAMIFRKRKNVLVLGTTKQVLHGEDLLFEKNIVASIMLSLKSESNINLTDNIQMNEILERLAEFIGCFTCTNVAAEKGFSLYARQSQLVHFDAMVSFLSQFDLVKIVSPDYFNELYKAVSNGEYDVEGDDNVVLLKTKFLLWCNDKWNDSFTITEYQEVPI